MRISIYYVIAIGIIFQACKKENKPEINNEPESEIDTVFYISDVSFSYDSNYIYSKSNIIINTDKLCNMENVKIYVGNDEATIISNSQNEITIQTPKYRNEYLSLLIKNDSIEFIIKDSVKVYPGGFSYQYLSDAPYEKRQIRNQFIANERGYIHGGYDYLGCYPDSLPNCVFKVYDDLWEYNPLNDEWKEVQKSIFYDLIMFDKFFIAESQLFIKNEAYIFNHVYNRLDSSYYLKIERFDSVTENWLELLAMKLKYPDWVKFSFHHKDCIYIGINRDIWCYNISTNSISWFTNYQVSDGGYLLPSFISGSIFYLFASSDIWYGEGVAGIDLEESQFYLINLDNKEQRKIDMTDIPFSTIQASHFGFDGYGIIGDGLRENGALFSYSTSYYKLMPE
jgi:hypothetical protein